MFSSRPVSWALPLLLLAGPAAAQDLANRTLERSVDVVVVEGEEVGDPILGTPNDRIRLYACRGSFMIPILFQIDQKDPSGTYCWNQGPVRRRIQDNDEDRFDVNDELVFMVRDAGNRAQPGALRTVPGAADVQELRIVDPLDDSEAWVYVYTFRGFTPPRVNTRLVSIQISPHPTEEDALWHRWRGEYWEIHNLLSPSNAARSTHARLGDPAEEDLSRGRSMIDCTMARGEASFMWVTLVRHSEDIELQSGGRIQGPIRVIVESRLRVYLAMSFWIEAPDSYLILWPDRVSMPTNVSSPVNLDESDVSSYTLVWDMRSTTEGWQFYNSHNPDPVPLDGRMSEAERNLDTTYPDWNCIYGPEGGMMSKFVIPESMQRETNRLVWIDDADHRHDEVENMDFEDGAYGTNGYFVDLRGLPEGTYPGDYVVWYLPPGFQPGDEQGYLNAYDHPVRVEVSQPGQ